MVRQHTERLEKQEEECEVMAEFEEKRDGGLTGQTLIWMNR